jgi:hypothetical protein
VVHVLRVETAAIPDFFFLGGAQGRFSLYLGVVVRYGSVGDGNASGSGVWRVSIARCSAFLVKLVNCCGRSETFVTFVFVLNAKAYGESGRENEQLYK